MRICFLGTRSVDPEQATSLGLLVEIGEKRLLLDCGPYTVKSLLGLGLEPQDIDAVFVSHDHADHAGGLPWFVATWLLASSRRPPILTLLCPHEQLAMLRYLEATYPRLFLQGSPRRLEVLRGSRLEFPDGAGSVDHVQLQHPVEVWGAVVGEGSAGERALAYLPDCASDVLLARSREIAPVRTAVMSVWGASHRRAEASQFGFPVAEEAGVAATELGAQRLFVQHLTDPGETDEVAAEIATTFAGDVIFPIPGEWITL